MLHNLLTKFKSNRINFANYYEKEFYSKRFLPMCLLQVGVDNTIPVWKKYLQRCNIYCIDSFDNKEPKSYGFLNFIIQNASINYIFQSGIAQKCSQGECGTFYHSNGIEFRLNGSSFYSFPFALSYQVHRPFTNDGSNKHYVKLLFEFME